MRFKHTKIEEIPNDFFQFENTIIFEKNHCIFKLKDTLLNKIYASDDFFIIENYIDNNVCLRNKNKLAFFEINNPNEIKEIPLFFSNSIQIKNIESNYIILRNNFDNAYWKINKINYFGKIIWTKNFVKPFNSYTINSNLVLHKLEDYKIEAIKLSDGTESWQHSFSSLLNEKEVSISNEIVEVSGVIYFILFGGGKKTCFSLDANTGKLLKTFSDIVGELIVENEFIYFLHSDVISILDTINDSIITWKIENLMIEKGIGRLWFPRWAVNNNLIYFSQSKDSDRYSDIGGAKFGILDPSKKELLWQNQLPEENGTIGKIKVYKEIIYLHTQDNTLHIFEKTNLKD